MAEGGTEDVRIELPDRYEKFGERVAVAGDVLAVELLPADEAERAEGIRIRRSPCLLWEWQGHAEAVAVAVQEWPTAGCAGPDSTHGSRHPVT